MSTHEVSRGEQARTKEALGIAETIAQQMFARFHYQVALDDLRSIARAAAAEAARRWDGRGIFPRFTVQRVRWRVLDVLRKRRTMEPNVEASKLRGAAAFAIERTADAVAVEQEAELFRSPVTLADLDRAASGAESAESGASGAAPDHREELRSFLDRSAAAFAISLDAAGIARMADPNVDVEGEVDRLRVRRAVESLPADLRMVVHRHAYAGETFEEIAVSCNESRSTVHAWYGRALGHLRRKLVVKE